MAFTGPGRRYHARIMLGGILRFDTSTARLRAVAFLEGLSFVLLVFVGMPLKYLAGQPLGVSILGPIHGALFVWLLVLIQEGRSERNRSNAWAIRLGAASLLPLGTFFFDRSLKADDEAFRDSQNA